MFECPNCHENTIDKATKFFMGPIRSTRCKNCDAKISIPYPSLFLLTLFFLFFSIIMNTQTFVWLKIGASIILTIVSTYGFYKWVPLIVKVRVGEKKKLLFVIRNIIISFVYFILTMTIMISMTRPLPVWFQREEITTSLIEINDILIKLETQVFEEGELKNISNYELMLAVEKAEEAIELVASQRSGVTRLNYYISSWKITNPLRTIEAILLEGETLDSLDRMLLRDIIEISKKSKIRDKSIYKLNLNLYTVPIELMDYFDDMSELYAKYYRLKE